MNRAGVRFAEPVMGTVFSFDVRGDVGAGVRAGLETAVAWLHEVDEVFSTYRPDSDTCRLDRGEISVYECHPMMAEVIDLGLRASADSGGAFSLHPKGRFDPSGVVKGWAVEQASELLRLAGSAGHLVNGGGDIQTWGGNGRGGGWRVAVVDPFDKRRPLVVVGAPADRGFAVATSGVAERGAHIVDGRRLGAPGQGLGGPWASITIVGGSLAEVDVAATTAFALGADGLDWVEERAHLAGLGVTRAGEVVQTGRLAAFLVD